MTEHSAVGQEDRTSSLADRLTGSAPLIGTFVTIAESAVVEIAAAAGLDLVVIDAEHGAVGPDRLEVVLGAAYRTGLAALVRIPAPGSPVAAYALDGGAEGILAPQIRTRAEAEQLTTACLYPPAGQRGWGPRRAAGYGLRAGDYVATAARRTCVMVQIETAEAVENLNEILEVPGLTAVMLGPNDLAASIGHLGRPEHPDVMRVIDKVIGVATDRGVPVGIACSQESAIAQAFASACNFAVYSADIAVLADGFSRLANSAEGDGGC